MKFSDWQKISLHLKKNKYYLVEWRCNWHRGHAFKKPNKRAKLFLIYELGNYLEFEGKRLSVRNLVSIEEVIKDVKSGA